MKTQCFGHFAILWLPALLMITNWAHAEIPKQSEKELRASASHAFTGTVVRIYSQEEKRGKFEYTYGVAEMAVEDVTQGTDVTANDRVFVRYWRKKWIGNGNPPPDHYGHWEIPAKTDSVEIYVKGDRKTGFDVLSPNGFFKVTKRISPEKKLSP